MEVEPLRAAARDESPPDRALLSAVDRGARLHAEVENPSRNATSVWPRRVRHLAKRGDLLQDPNEVLADLTDLAAEGTSFTVVIYRLATESGEEVYTAMLAGQPARVRAAFAHRRTADPDSLWPNPSD